MPETNQHSPDVVPDKDKLERLNVILDGLRPGLIAVSGGVDSRTLHTLALRRGGFAAVFFRGPHMSEAEVRGALEYLEGSGGAYTVLEVDPLILDEVRGNSRERCYHCKRTVFGRALDLARERGARYVLDGTQASDSGAYRPGRKALAELGVRSPLAEAGLYKPEVRGLAKSLGLEVVPARPCLLTRYAYGLEADAATLARLGQAEEALAGLGLGNFRLRIPAPGSYLLQIEEGEREALAAGIEELAVRTLAGLGFSPVEVQWKEGISGYYDSLGQGNL